MMFLRRFLRVSSFLQLDVLGLGLAQRQGVADDHLDLVVLAVLLQIGERAEVHRVDGRLLAGVGGHDDHRAWSGRCP